MTLTQAIETAKSKTTDRRWINAINKAGEKLSKGELFVTLLSDDTALVTSENGSYRVNGHCQCKAAQNDDPKCYHRAAKRLVEMMEAVPAASTKSELIESIEAAWDARYGKRYDLGQSLIKRFGHTDMNGICANALRSLLAAIA
jgi:hypothetical protein